MNKERNSNDIIATSKKRTRKLMIIWSAVIAIPLSIFLGVYFGMGGKERANNIQDIKDFYNQVFVEKSGNGSEYDIASDDVIGLTTSTLALFEMYDSVPNYSASASFAQVTKDGYDWYQFETHNFSYGDATFNLYGSRVIFQVKDFEIVSLAFKESDGSIEPTTYFNLESLN